MPRRPLNVESLVTHGVETTTPYAAPEQEAPFEMANLRPATTGLSLVVFVSQRGGARHGARIKVSPLPRYDPAQAVTVTLEDPPHALGPIGAREMAEIGRWIALNREAIQAYWDGTIEYTEDLLARLKPI